MLVERVPVQILPTDYNFPKNDEKRHFSDDFCGRRLPNGERDNGSWLVQAFL
jgi:hypothetical protein